MLLLTRFGVDQESDLVFDNGTRCFVCSVQHSQLKRFIGIYRPINCAANLPHGEDELQMEKNVFCSFRSREY